MKKVTIYTDGACSGNPGVGGWSAILIYNQAKREIYGYDKHTTNNRMELFAIIQALRCLKEPCECAVCTDSAYVSDAFNKDWITQWQLKNWRTASNKEVKNIDLWQSLLSLLEIHKVTFVKVKGHANVELNERCDYLARNAIDSYVKQESEN